MRGGGAAPAVEGGGEVAVLAADGRVHRDQLRACGPRAGLTPGSMLRAAGRPDAGGTTSSARALRFMPGPEWLWVRPAPVTRTPSMGPGASLAPSPPGSSARSGRRTRAGRRRGGARRHLPGPPTVAASLPVIGEVGGGGRGDSFLSPRIARRGGPRVRARRAVRETARGVFAGRARACLARARSSMDASISACASADAFRDALASRVLTVGKGALDLPPRRAPNAGASRHAAAVLAFCGPGIWRQGTKLSESLMANEVGYCDGRNKRTPELRAPGHPRPTGLGACRERSFLHEHLVSLLQRK